MRYYYLIPTIASLYVNKTYSMSKRGENEEFYKNHINPHNIKFNTFMKRVYILGQSREEALSFPFLKGGDRKTIKFLNIRYSQIVIEQFDIDKNTT